MVMFKNYDGQIINLSDVKHTHSIEDTVRSGSTAYADSNNDGFIRSTDIITINQLVDQTNMIQEKLQTAVFIKQYAKAILKPGMDFRSAIYSRINSAVCNLVFKKDPIPSSYISSATVVSTDDSEVKAYIYTNGDSVICAPEKEDTIVYANPSMNGMFIMITNLLNIDFSGLNTSLTTNMSSMFTNSKISVLDLSNFDTSNVTDMSSMFGPCNVVTIKGLSNWDTSNVTNMSSMFASGVIAGLPSTSKLVTVEGLDKLNTSNVTNMSKMFEGCAKLSGSITIMNPNINNYSGMFTECSTASGTSFKVNYISGCSSKASSIVATKSSSSNVLLGTLV